MNYLDFLASKRRQWAGEGCVPERLAEGLYDWQTAIARWALRKGRAALFADCGLGKTRIQLAWANALPVERVIILAPLCVASQTIAEGALIGIPVRYVTTNREALTATEKIVISNYDRVDALGLGMFDAIVLDESSILKSFDGKTRTKLIKQSQFARFRLCCTATPAPNDIAELANHAEFLGLMTRPEFLATWFVHDEDGWRMKRHASRPFYRWLASWALAMRTPSDLGYNDDGFILPELRMHQHITSGMHPVPGALFPEMVLSGLSGRLAARRGSLVDRLDKTATLAQAPGQWIMWCGLNQESSGLAERIDGAVEVKGSDTHAEKSGAISDFVSGAIRVLVTKAKILGFGMNFQHCHQMAFVGIGDSYETYYQAIRRCWRFGQRQPVDCHIIVSRAETMIIDNVRAKELAAQSMCRDLVAHMADMEREELQCVATDGN